ncbi:gamma-tubulin complex component 4 homolog isoform X2 [Drosophila kikkawai]|uniref:Gamma-tubulin complex component n=1 Tax=Drosophila kikkawai TaxID=30033 RepID=A0A6P4IR50_DROKI|nr:gamma-tubulin complex component 4 homolog isoform X2 [Drosophila kikkawai]
MIHDLLLACLSSSREGQGVKQFLDTTAVEHFFHPCETEIFMGILNIMNVYHEVVEFTQIYSTKPVQSEESTSNADFEDLSHGFYMLNFVKGIESALEESYQEIVRLEADCRKTKRNSLSYVHNALRTKLPMLMLVRKLIMEVKVMKLRGCALLHNLHQQSEHGDPQLERVVQKVIKPVKYAFFSSLAHWMLFGVIDDIHTEFFINFIPLESGQGSTCSKSTQSFISSAEQTTEDYIWQYEINMKQLPGFLSIISAEKVLFVGQTVLVFKMGRNPKSKNKMDQMAVELNDMSREDIYELWNGRESEFFKTIQDLSNDDKINVFRIEQVVNEIKKFVSRRLSEIAVNEVDLERQMGLLKDFYLLGRGEFFLEFFSQLYGNFDINTEMRSRNYTRAFELAATGLRITDDLENFSLSSLRNSEEPDESYDFQVLQSMHLKYIYEWPLNLLFSPKAIERYNKIFRFLLIIRGLQYQMQRVWATQTWTEKAESGGTNIRVMNLRNHLLFFLNNLQYYIQVSLRYS